MAILQMKRLRLMLVRSQKEELLRELTRLGCVQLVEQEEELQEQESGSVTMSCEAVGRCGGADHALSLACHQPTHCSTCKGL